MDFESRNLQLAGEVTVRKDNAWYQGPIKSM